MAATISSLKKTFFLTSKDLAVFKLSNNFGCFEFSTGQLKEVITWLKEQPHYSLERVVSGSEFLELELVQKLEQVLEPYNAEKHKVSHVIMQVKPSLLYKVRTYLLIDLRLSYVLVLVGNAIRKHRTR